MKSKEKSRHIIRHNIRQRTGNLTNSWDTAISDAEKVLEGMKKKVARLERSIEVFREFRDSGSPFPGENAAPPETERQ
jgi:hypothetical protein